MSGIITTTMPDADKQTGHPCFAPAADRVRAIAGGRRASLMLPDEDNVLRIAAASGLPPVVVTNTRVPLGAPIAGMVAQTRRAMIANSAQDIVPPKRDRYNSAAFISVPFPLAAGGCGVLNVADPEAGRAFDSGAVARVVDFAEACARESDLIAAQWQVQLLQDTVRELRRQRIRVQEEERHRIARDLHDEAGHALAATIFQLDMEAARLIDTAPELHASLLRVRGGMLDCVDTLHDIAFTLRPRILEDLGLTAALQSLVKKARAATHCQITLTVDDNGAALSEPIELAVFRVAQEALTNIRKYAAATRASIRLTIEGGWLQLVIDDNGIGIGRGARSATARPSLGIAGMRERIELLGGSFAIGAGARGGTRLTALVPVGGDDERGG